MEAEVLDAGGRARHHYLGGIINRFLRPDSSRSTHHRHVCSCASTDCKRRTTPAQSAISRRFMAGISACGLSARKLARRDGGGESAPAAARTRCDLLHKPVFGCATDLAGRRGLRGGGRRTALRRGGASWPESGCRRRDYRGNGGGWPRCRSRRRPRLGRRAWPPRPPSRAAAVGIAAAHAHRRPSFRQCNRAHEARASDKRVAGTNFL